MFIVRGLNYYPQDIEAVVEADDRVRKGCVAAIAREGDEDVALVVVAEVRDAARLPDARALNRRLLESLGVAAATFVFVAARTIPMDLPKAETGEALTSPLAVSIDPSGATWLDAGAGSVGGRVGRAVVGWAPLALGLGWLVGEITGCGRFSASCDASASPLLLLVQLAALAVLLLVPRLAAIAIVGAVGTLVAAIPGALVLASMGGASDGPSSRAALAILLIAGWLTGTGLGLVREVRRARPVDRPVS